MLYAEILSCIAVGYASTFLILAHTEIVYVASKYGLVRHRLQHFHHCGAFLKHIYAPIIFLHFLIHRSFWLEFRLPQMQSCDSDRAAFLPAVQQIGLVGGLVIWSDEMASVSFMRRPLTDDQLSIVGSFTPLVDLNLSHTLVTDAGLQHMCHLHKLQNVDVTNTSVTDAGVESLRSIAPSVLVIR